MRRLRKWLLILGSITVLLAAAVVLTWLFFGPAIARNIIAGKLRGLGIEESAFQIERLSLDTIELSGIALGPDTWLEIESGTATYGPFDLLRGRLKTLTLRDAAWTIRADDDDGSIDWGFPAQPGGSGTIVPDLPFETIEIIRSTATLERGDDAAIYDIEGTIQEVGTHHLKVSLKVSSGELAITLEGEAAGEQAMAASADVSLAGAVPAWLAEFLPRHVAITPPVEATLSLAGSYSTTAGEAARLEVNVREPSPLRAKAVSLPGVELENIDATLVAIEDRPLLAVHFADEGPDYECAARLVGADSLNFASETIDAIIPGYGVDFSIANGVATGIPVRITIEDAAIELPRADMTFRGVVLDAPLSIGMASDSAEFPISAAEPAVISIAEVRWRDRTVEGGEGALTLERGRLTGLLQWQPTEETDITVRLNGDLAGDSPRATILFTSAPFQIEAGSPTAALVTGSPDWTLAGLFALDGMIGFGEGGPDPHILLSVEDGSVSRADEQIALSGIDGSVELDRITPLLTPDVQRVTVEAGRLGELTVTGGEVEVRADGDGLVRFERFIASMGEYGVFQADPFTIDPAAPRIATTVRARNMSLGPWLDLIAQDKLRGEGTLAGRIHIAWDAAQPKLFTIEDSTLAAQPSRGWLAVSEENDLRALLEEGDPRFSDDDFMGTVGEKIVAAIQDFAFTSLQLGFEEGAEGTDFRIVTRGRGRKGEDPQEIGSLTLNMHAPFRVFYLAVMDPQRLREFFNPPE